MPVGVAVLPRGRPKSLRKLTKSAGLMSVWPTMAMVCPVPSMGVLYVPEGKDVVDRGEVVRGDAVGDVAALVDGEGGLGDRLGPVGDARGEVGDGVVAEGADLVAGGFAGEVVEGGDAGDDGGQGSGDGGVGGVGEVLLSIDRVFVHAGAEGGANHAGGAAKLDQGAGGVDLYAGEAVAGEPGGDG